MIYMNMKLEDGSIETIDEFDTRKEASVMAKEYRTSGTDAYISSRSTKDWREKQEKEGDKNYG